MDCLHKTEQLNDILSSMNPEPSTSGSTLEERMVDELISCVDVDCSFSCDGLLLETLGSEHSANFGALDCNFANLAEILNGLDNFLNSSVGCSTDNMKNEQLPNVGDGGDKINVIKTKEKKSWGIIKKGQIYMPNFKRKVLNYAVKHTFKETAKKFKVNCNTLTEWAREYKRLLLLKKSTTSRPGSTEKTDKTITMVKTDNGNQDLSSSNGGDAMFLNWLRMKRTDGCRVQREEVQAAALQCWKSGSDSARWFNAWIRRFCTQSEGGSDFDNSKSEKHIIYPVNFKIEAALYAREYTKLEAAKTFGISSRRLYEWCERLEAPEIETGNAKARQLVDKQLLAWFNQRKSAGMRPKSIEIMEKARGLYAANGLAHIKCSQGWLSKVQKRLNLKLVHSDDDELLLWILSQLDNNVSLTVLQVTSKACELATRNNITSFKGSKGWTLRFLKRHSHLLQCSSVMLSELPVAAANQAKSFCLALQQRVGAAGLPPASVGCMDEIPITFVYPSEKMPSPPLLRKAALETAHAVVLLAATSDGCLLPPAVVLKGSRGVHTYYVDEISIPVLYHEAGGVGVATLQEWLQVVWFRYVAAPSVLVVDSYAPHSDKQLSEKLSAGCCHIAVIPAGCAVHLQPCGFNLSRRFQECVQDEWVKVATGSNAMAYNAKTVPEEEAILKWIAEAYFTLRKDSYSIKSSFHLTGLTKPTCSN